MSSSNTALQDHYATLNISPTADPDTIKKAYRALALEYHPDKASPDEQQEATSAFQKVHKGLPSLFSISILTSSSDQQRFQDPLQHRHPQHLQYRKTISHNSNSSEYCNEKTTQRRRKRIRASKSPSMAESQGAR